jgi:cysteinyl-tRNA synthetase
MPIAATGWVYWLQDADLDVLRERLEPVFVLDYSRDGTDDEAFTAEDIASLRDGPAGARDVIAYMSIGEAEDYRYYWQDGWSAGSPSWLDGVNPDWAGNFKVRYWDPDWQAVIFGSPETYLDKILAAGFSGVYLDIIDAYNYYEDQGRDAAEQEMVAFVRAISEHAKAVDPDFLIIPQNAPELGRIPAYLEAVDGVAQEGPYYGYDEPDQATPAEVTAELEEHLDRFTAAGKLVLVVDYASSPENVTDAYGRAAAKGYAATVTDVALAGPPAPLGAMAI